MPAKRSVPSLTPMPSDSYLTNDCWEHVISFLDVNNSDQRYLQMRTLSLVCQQFLFLTNTLRLSLTVCKPTSPCVVFRFPNIVSLDLSGFHGDLDALLSRISCSSLRLKELNLSNQPSIASIGLLAKTMEKSLISLKCSNLGCLKGGDIRLIANCFPLLEDLDLSFPSDVPVKFKDDEIECLSLKLRNLRKVNLSGYLFNVKDLWLFHFCYNCEFLEEMVILDCCMFVTHEGIGSAIRKRPSLKSLYVTNLDVEITDITPYFIESLVSLKQLTCLDLSHTFISDELLTSIAHEALPLRKLVLQGCHKYSYNGISCLLSKCRFIQHLDIQHAYFLNDEHIKGLSLFLGDLVYINVSGCGIRTETTLIAIIGNCPLLNEVRMENTLFGERGELDPNDLLEFSVTSNHEVRSLYLGCNLFPVYKNIQVLASICPNLRVLDLSRCFITSKSVGKVFSRGKIHGMSYEVPKLEVLNLSRMVINDETLFKISKSCPGLLQLDLKNCLNITENGVRIVIQNCLQLREINLNLCYNVDPDIVTWMVFFSPSLRRIKSPPHFHISDYLRRLFVSRGCHVS